MKRSVHVLVGLAIAIVIAAALALVPAPLHAQRMQANTTAPDSARSVDRPAFLILIRDVRRTLLETADAMPATKYGFVPPANSGDFANVRSFSRQLKHLAATNYILSAAALGQSPPSDAGDEQGPDSVVTKAQIIAYLGGSYDALERAGAAIGDPRVPVVASPISPLQGGTATRSSLIAEALIHGYDHYGQMVEYLRMNGIIPPASRR